MTKEDCDFWGETDKTPCEGEVKEHVYYDWEENGYTESWCQRHYKEVHEDFLHTL